MASLSSATFQIEIPAQILSLLANQAGHYIITFSDNTTKARLSHKLYHTLFRGKKFAGKIFFFLS